MNQLESGFQRTEFLSKDECILDAAGSASEFDEDDDLVLAIDTSAPTLNAAQIRFEKPIKGPYQFIEVDVYAINDNALINVIAIQDFQHSDPVAGTYARVPMPFNIGHLRTYRFPYIGEIEGFIFTDFVSTGTFVVKSIRVYSLPENWKLAPLDDPDTALELGIRYQDLVGFYENQTQTYEQLSAVWNAVSARWEFTFEQGPGIADGIASFVFTSSRYGVIRVSVPQLGRTGIGYTKIADQLTLLQAVEASAKRTETLVDLDVVDVPIELGYRATTIGLPGIEFWIELFQVVENSDINAWGCTTPLEDASTSEIVVGARGSQGLTGQQGAQGSQGYQGDTGPQGATGGQGVQGFQGTQGRQGFQGLTGPQGAFGGPQGTQGVQGSQGTDGSPGGAQGSQGATGAQGPQGVAGAAGTQGSQGTTGSTGTSKSQEFTSSGTFNVPVGVTGIQVTGVAGGGGGAGRGAASTTGAGGGGSGEMVSNWPLPVTSGGTLAITIGAGGTAGASGGPNAGGTGGSTIVGTVTLLGGLGGVASGLLGGNGGGPNGGLGSGSVAAIGTAESPNHFGGSGGGVGAVAGVAGAPGAGSGGITAGGAGGAVVSSKAGGGGGAASLWGIGGAGGDGNGAGNAAPGTSYGAGGGGAGANTSNPGGAGAPGYILITWLS